MKKESLSTFEEIVANILSIDPDQLKETTSPATLSNWTSLRHIELIVALEQEYHISFSRSEIRALRSVKTIREKLLQKGVTL